MENINWIINQTSNHICEMERKYDGCSLMSCIQFVVILLLVFYNTINKLYEDLQAIGRQILMLNNNKLHKLLLWS